MILYICDRKACENCHEECKHTSDISHAVHFENLQANGVIGTDYWENDILPMPFPNGTRLKGENK